MRNPFEIAKRFRYVGDADERIGELAHQLGKARDLMPVDYADEQTLFLVRKAAQPHHKKHRYRENPKDKNAYVEITCFIFHQPINLS